MNPYQKMLNVYRRDRETNILTDEFAVPEFGHLLEAPWEATEKLDGTNVRLILDLTSRFKVWGRSDGAQLPPKLHEHCAALETRIRRAFDVATDVCLYGEGVGPRIQKGGERYGDTQHFRLFDVKVGRWWLTGEQVREVGDGLGIPVAPFIGTMTLGTAISMWWDWPEPPRSRIFDGVPEGWVLRPAGGLLFRSGDPIRAKIKERDFAVLRKAGAV